MKNRESEKNVCGKDLPKGSKAYRCHTCKQSDKACFCIDCFQMSDHKGHKFEEITMISGFCDCGDPKNWDENHFCELHGGPAYVPSGGGKNQCMKQISVGEEAYICKTCQ